MSNSESEILTNLRQHAEEASSLFSNAGQALQERTAVAGFLRVLRVPFEDNEIVKRGPEPIDVWFRDARFQVTEILDSGRPRNLEIKNRLDRVRNAKSLKDLIEPVTISGTPISLDELVVLASTRSQEKSRRYAGDGSSIDLLIYVNLQHRHVFPSGPFPKVDESAFKGWRSVSVVMEHFAVVLAAANNAPAFLAQHQGKPTEWEGLDSVFPQLDAEERGVAAQNEWGIAMLKAGETPQSLAYERRVVAFYDILGWRKHIERAGKNPERIAQLRRIILRFSQVLTLQQENYSAAEFRFTRIRLRQRHTELRRAWAS